MGPIIILGTCSIKWCLHYRHPLLCFICVQLIIWKCTLAVIIVPVVFDQRRHQLPRETFVSSDGQKRESDANGGKLYFLLYLRFLTNQTLFFIYWNCCSFLTVLWCSLVLFLLQGYRAPRHGQYNNKFMIYINKKGKN